MSIMQLSVFLENRPGRIKEVLGILKENNMNIRALSLADKSSYGMLRLILNDCDKASEALKKKGISVSMTPVMALEVPDKPGGLLGIIEVLEHDGINVEYIYAFSEKAGDKAVVVIRVDDTGKAEKLFSGKGIRVLEERDIKTL